MKKNKQKDVMLSGGETSPHYEQGDSSTAFGMTKKTQGDSSRSLLRLTARDALGSQKKPRAFGMTNGADGMTNKTVGNAVARHDVGTWRKIALAALSILMLITLTFAIVKVVPANAAEDGVLEGNTAEYTIQNDTQHPWVYDRDANVWYNNSDDNDSKDKYGNTATLFNKVLTLTIASSGNVAFRYRTNLGNAINWQNTSNFYLELTKDGVTNTILAKHGEKMADYEEVFLTNLSAGDKIVFKHQTAYLSSSRQTDKVYIQGLRKPEAGASNVITAKAEANGTIVCGEEESANMEEAVAPGASLTVTAKPNEGYVFKCWKDDTDTVIYEDTLNLTPTAAATYTAYFVEKDFKPAFTLDGWTEEGGTYKLSNPDQACTSTLTYEFVGEQYINYTLSYPDGFQYTSQNTLKTYLNGKAKGECGDYGGELPIFPYSSYPPYTPKGYIHIGGEGYHRLDFVFEVKDTSSGNIIEIKDWTTSDTYQGDTTEIELSYNKNCGTVYIDGKATEPGNVTVPKGYKVRFSVSVNPTTMSSIDPTQEVAVNWVGFYTLPGQNNAPPQSNYNELHGDGIISLYSPYTLTFNDTGANYNPMEDEASGFSYYITQISCHHIEARMSEQLSMPQVGVSAIVDGSEEKEQEIKNGGVYEIKYGSETSLGVSMDDIPNTEETYHIKFNGEEQEDIQIIDNEGSKFFTLSNVSAKTTVTISRSAEGFLDSEEFTFTIEVVSDGGINDILAEGAEGITVENDEYVPWKFSAELSGENGIAYMAGNSGLLSYYGIAVSTLKFTLTGQGDGFLHFDFSVRKGTYWLLYSDKRPFSITDKLSAIAYAADKKDQPVQDAGGTQLWWINEEPGSWQSIVAQGRTGNNGVFNYNYMQWPCGANTDPETSGTKNYDDKIDLDNKKTYTFLETNWAHVSIPVTVEGTKNIYVSYYRDADAGIKNTDKSSIPWRTAEYCDYAAIRNVAFLKGDAQIDYAAVDAAGNAATGGTVKAVSDGKDVTPNGKIPLGSRITFTATENEGQFYGWVTTDGKLISLDKEYSTAVYTSSYSIRAVFGTTGQYIIRNDGKYFETLKEALEGRDADGKDKAVAGDKLIVLRDGLTISENIDIPAGITLVLPVDEKGADFHFGVAEDTKHNIQANSTPRVPWSSQDLIDKFKNFTLTVASGQTLTIRGTLAVGAIQHYPEQSAQGATSGKYNVLDIKENGSVVVEEGGHLDVRGLVTGDGGITVKKGGKLTQPFMILDFSGGTNTKALFNAGVTPFKMYGMVNIQCKLGYTIEYGGALWGHASLYALLGNQTLDAAFISGNPLDSPLLLLKETSKVTATYDDSHERPDMGSGNNAQDVGKTTMTVTGGATAGYMQFPMNINTSGVYFSLPYNYELILKPDEKGNGDYDVANNFKLMPGSVVKVEAGAKLNVKGGKGLHVYDSFLGPKFNKREYPTSDQLKTAGYNPYASLIVNGTLNIEDGATFLGTVQTTDTTGTAKIIVGNGVTLTDNLFDGAATMYGCNYTEYTLTAQVYDHAHKGADGKGTMGKLEAGKTYVSTAEGATGWTLPGITFKYETTTSTDGNNTHNKDKDHHDLNEGVKTADATEGLQGSWKTVHTDCVYDWEQLSDEEKNFGEAKFKQLDRQCTEIGCNVHDHKLLINSAAVVFSETYKGAAFTQDDVLKLFYQIIFGEDTLPDAYSYFTAEVGQLNRGSTMQNANTYDAAVPLTLSGGWFDNVTTDNLTFDFKIDKFNVENLDKSKIEAAIAEKGFTYNGEEQKLSNEELEAVLTAVGLEGKVSHDVFDWQNNVNAGTTASVTITGTGNFEGTLTITFSIAKANLSVTLVAAGHTYGETPKTPDITLEGVQNNEETQIKSAITRTPIATQWSDVGDYGVTWGYNEETGVLANYEISFTNKDAEIYKVTAKDITEAATATAAGATYNGKAQEAALTFVFEGHEEYLAYFEKTTDYTVTYAKDGEISPVSAGTYTVTIAGTGNYSGSITCEYVISPKAVTVKVNPQTFTYNRSEHSYNAEAQDAWTAEGLENNEDKSVLNVTITGSGTEADTYSVTCGYTNGNYTVTFEGEEFALVIEAAEISSVEITGSYTYDGSEQTPTLTVQAGGLTLESGEYTASYDKTVKDADTYTVTVTANSKNFKNGSEDVTATFTVAKKAITVTAKDIAGTYGDEKPEPKDFTVESGALVGGDQQSVLNVTLTLQEADKYEFGEEYEITGTGEAANYDITVTPGKYTVTKKAITVKADDIVGTYGEKAPTAFTFTVPVGALEYDDQQTVLSVTLALASADKYVVNAEYAITGEGTADNYTITVTAGKYTVKAKDITVTILEQKVTYNAAKQSPTSNYGTGWTVTGLVNGDTYGDLGVTLSATGDCLNVGSYDITGTATAANYSVKFSDGTEKFVIEKKGITVTATSLNLPEGTTKQSVEDQLDFTVDGLFDDDNDVREHIVVSVEYDESAKQGKTFDITVAFKDDYEPQNYEVKEFVKGVLSIIDSKFKDVVFEGNSFVYDGTLHTLTATGLPEGAVAAYAYAKGESALGSAGVKDAGSYTVTLTVTLEGYQDYTKSVQLTITQKAIVIKADDVNKVYGEELVENTALTFTVPADALAEGDKQDVLTVSLSWGHDRNVGEHPITGTATAENYTVTVTAGTYHITAKPITVNILSQTWATYNTSEQSVHNTVSNWNVTDDALAWDDSKETLKVTLTGSGTDAGSYDIEGKSANGNYEVTFEGGDDAFVIAKKDIEDAKIEVLGGTFTYKEAQWKPEITVTLAGFGTLEITEEYTVAYGNNTTVKEGGNITITGEGNFTGTAQTTFEILPMSIAELEITLNAPENVIYDGTQQRPQFSVKLEGFTSVDLLAAEYGKNIDAGENAGSLTVRGTDNFTGTVTKNFDIHARPVTVTVQKQTVTYNQQPQKASSAETYWNVADLAEKDKASDLHVTLTAEGTDAGAYDIVCAWTNSNYAVTFKGADLTAEGATVKEAFVIGAAALTEATLTSKHTYNGGLQTPTFAVKAGGLNVADGDFELVFADDADRVSAGTVQVTVKAASKNYSGELAKDFTIAKKQVKATLQPQSFVYSGAVPTPNHKAYTVEEGGLCSRDGVQDDLKVTISIVDGQKDVHTYALTAVAGNGDYSVTFENSTLTITQKEITVKADDITSVYGSPIEKLTYTAEGLVEGEDPAKVLKVTLQTGTIKDEGQYEITGSGSAANYTFTVEKGTYTVSPKQITVTIVNKSSVYDGKEPAITSVQGTDWTVENGAIEEGDDLRIKLTKAAGVTVTKDGYAITGEFNNHNYTVTWKNGTYTIEARKVTVEILDQQATYDYHETKAYAFDGTKWRVDAETLAPDEDKSVLGVTLTKPDLSGAGTYEIAGKWNNDNYAVSFTGSFENRGGTYTIEKLDISDDAVFILGLQGGGVEEDSDGRLWMRFAGKALELTGDVTFFTDKDKISFAKTNGIKIDPAALEKVGNYKVTISIEDANFMGSAVFEVVVTNENGYTERLEQTLARLRELKAGLTKETLQAKDFAALKEMSALISALDEEELNVASEELAEYEALMEYWNDAADIGAAIETAEKIGDAPIEALFGAVAALTALCGLAYIAMKGGML